VSNYFDTIGIYSRSFGIRFLKYANILKITLVLDYLYIILVRRLGYPENSQVQKPFEKQGIGRREFTVKLDAVINQHRREKKTLEKALIQLEKKYFLKS